MTEQEKNKFCAVLMENYGIRLSPNNELLPILYIMYGLVVQMGRTVTSFLESIAKSEKKLEDIADKVVETSESYIRLVDTLGHYQKKLAESTEENKSLLSKISELQTAHIKLVNEQNEAIMNISKLVKETSEKDKLFNEMISKFEVIINNGGLIKQEAPKKKNRFFGFF